MCMLYVYKQDLYIASHDQHIMEKIFVLKFYQCYKCVQCFENTFCIYFMIANTLKQGKKAVGWNNLLFPVYHIFLKVHLYTGTCM
jgi:hypothetical protein